MAVVSGAEPGSEARASASTMTAVVGDRYGSPDVLRLEQVDKPDIGQDGVLVRVRAAAINALDWRMLRGQPYVARPLMGIRHPRESPRGSDLAGIVEAVGPDVTAFRPGDEVFGTCTGAFAEYVCGATHDFMPKPSSLTFEQAAAIPVAACTALQALRDHGRLQPGQTVLINGAGGGVGTFTVQIAKALGGHVTAACSTQNVEMVGSIGADEVIDYTKADFTRSGRRCDLVVDIAGSRSLRDLRRVLKPKGTLILVGGGKGKLLGPLALPLKAKLLSPFVGQTIVFFMAKVCTKDLDVLTELVDTGTVTPVIDRIYTLNDVPDAIRYLEAGHVRGKVVVTT